ENSSPVAVRRGLILNTLMVAGSFALAAGMGLLRNMVIAQQFGIGAELDAFYAAFKLPDLLFTIVAGGALATAFIPVLAEFVAQDDRAAVWRLASAITNLVVIAVSMLAGLAALSAPWLVRTLIAPGFDAAQQAETALLMRIVLLSTIFFGISAVQSSVLHSFKHFLLPALAPVLYPLGIMAGALWLVPQWGTAGLAWGAVLGAVLHLLVKIPMLLHYGFRWQPVLDLNRSSVHKVLWLMGPRVLDLGVFHLTLLASANLASRLGTGSVSALEWGWEFMQLPETIIGTAFGLVVFPTLAEQAAQQNLAQLRRTLSESLSGLLFLTVPAACGLILLGRPLVQLVYQRGAFDVAATEAVYAALVYYALGLVGHVCLEVAARVFFAQQDTITPLIVAASMGLLNVLMGIALMGPLGYGGLALANSLAVTVEVLVLLFILRRRWGGIGERRMGQALARVVAASLLMCGAIAPVVNWSSTAQLHPLLILLLGGSVGLVVYAIISLLMLRRTPIQLARELVQAVSGS
ncbi:MAG: murein biosynthesis integral membrane protein MurJ, partial [Caldilineaceae bacterium]|nr:murein biosynthesis integral membrane protein MurJ [Caldilineaceae bacterium]